MFGFRTVLLAAAATACSLAALTQVSIAGSINDLPGRWSGWGSIALPSGSAEQVKCIATYFLKDGEANLVQNLRCASSSYKIDATATLAHAAGKLTGEWEEKTYSAKGQVTGVMNPEGFALDIKGDNLKATLVVKSTNCKQSVLITPIGMEISKITISLEKC
jgi:hypothetical protein